MKIGIYGGTFNPPHLGHITAARTVFELLKLDQLLLIPAGMPPHKDLPAGSPTPDQRLEMTRLAGEQIGLGDRVQVLDMELRREGRSFTSDTLRQLREEHPDDELWLLMGTDPPRQPRVLRFLCSIPESGDRGDGEYPIRIFFLQRGDGGEKYLPVLLRIYRPELHSE